MKTVSSLLSVMLLLVFAAPIVGQDDSDVVTPPVKVVTDPAVELVIAQNVVRTAYIAVRGKLEGFDVDRVTLAPITTNDEVVKGAISPWLPYSRPFAARLGRLRLAEEKGIILHLWVGLLENRKLAKLILAAHYYG